MFKRKRLYYLSNCTFKAERFGEMAARDCLFDLTLLIEQCNNILTVHVGLTDNGINNILSLVSAS